MSATEPRATTSSYAAGFVLSLACTLAAYWLVVNHLFSKWTLAGLIAIFALSQFVVQIVLFLHLGKELKPRWRLTVFVFMALVVIILVGGSLWIMYSLNYTMVPMQSMNQYMQDQIQNGL